ncbi:hypothetical protein HPB47_006301 [Ixodes persulcatus]|uniref:Uncharacterized protein n=1 Tax=Ixodes persulcatus TaxID=34615 RepID=A0AC60PAT4_IXOPE|nr:hypothetical protein HPB47_006301 [Ixodes persulcatus]
MGTKKQPWSALITVCSECAGCSLTEQVGRKEDDGEAESYKCRPCMRIAMLEQKLEQRAEEVMERHTRELNQKFGNALEAMHHELVTRMTTREHTTLLEIQDFEKRLSQSTKLLEDLKQKEQRGQQMGFGHPRASGEKDRSFALEGRETPTEQKKEMPETPTPGNRRRVMGVGDSNVNRFKRNYLRKLLRDERVQVIPLPGKGVKEVREVIEAAKSDDSTMVIVHAGLNDCLTLKSLDETTKTIEQMATKLPRAAIHICTQPEITAMGKATLDNLREYNDRPETLCAKGPENLERVDLRWTKEKIKYPFNIEHYTEAASEAGGGWTTGQAHAGFLSQRQARPDRDNDQKVAGGKGREHSQQRTTGKRAGPMGKKGTFKVATQKARMASHRDGSEIRPCSPLGQPGQELPMPWGAEVGTRPGNTIVDQMGEPSIQEVGTPKNQGCPLSPTLFNIYINDLLRRLEEEGAGLRLSTITKDGDEDYTRIPCLAFADDVVLMAETAADMQHLMNNCTEEALRDNFKFNAKKNTVAEL